MESDSFLEAAPQNPLTTEFLKACQENDIETVQAILKQQPEMAALGDYNGWTALHCAVGYGHMEIVELLISHGADVNAVDKSGWSALRYAVLNANVELIQYLLLHGADINAVDNGGWSLLHYAASSGQTHIALLLLENGGNPTQSTTPKHRIYPNKTPAGVAQMRGDPVLATRLKEAEKKWRQPDVAPTAASVVQPRYYTVEEVKALMDHAVQIGCTVKIGDLVIDPVNAR